jgi:hypothetical protein
MKPKPKTEIINLEQAQEFRNLLTGFAARHDVLDDRVKSHIENNLQLLDAYITVYSDDDWRFKRFYVQTGYGEMRSDGSHPYRVWDKENGNAWLINPSVKPMYHDKTEAKAVVDRLNSEYPRPYELRGGGINGWRIKEMATGLMSDEVYTSLQVAYDEECRLNAQVKEGM